MDNRMGEQSGLSGACGRLTIDLGALRDNYLALCDRAAPAKVAAVVKADAYGLGADRVAPVLYDAGCRTFFVAHFGEALKLKPWLRADARIFVLNGLLPGDEAACADAGIVPVLNSLEQLANWSSQAGSRRTRLPAILQFDTGMARLGLSAEEVSHLAADRSLIDGVDLLFIMSHLASADNMQDVSNAGQLSVMRKVAAAFPGVDLCFANSAGVFLGKDYHGALVRPGVALYGGAPSASAVNPMRPVVRLDVRVIQTRTVPAGTRVGYGGVHVASGEMRLATIAAGYADGLPRHLSDSGAAYFDGIRLPIAGRVSMDSITLDVTALPPGTLKLGATVELIGPHQTLEAMAADAGTISYEILTRLGHRYHREYRYPEAVQPAQQSRQ